MFAGHHSSHATKIWKGVFSCRSKTCGHLPCRQSSFNFLHVVTLAFGTNFLSKGHICTITDVLHKELFFFPNEKFPDMTEMLEFLLLKASEMCMVTEDFVGLHKAIDNLYSESSAQEVSL